MDQPIISEDNIPFIVKVKNLSNQVFEFTVDPQMKVSDFKILIKDRVNVPVQRQRLVFSGKQLSDDQPISQYLKQSGVTIHIIAKKLNAQQNSNPQQQNFSGQQSTQSNPLPPSPFNPFAMFSRGNVQQMPTGDLSGLMNDVMGLIGGDLNSSNPPNIQEMFTRVTGSMSNLIQRQQQRGNNTQQGQQSQQNSQQMPQQSPQVLQRNISDRPSSQSQQLAQQQQFANQNEASLRNLNQVISRVYLPVEIRNTTTNNPRSQLSGYLNGLQLQMMRVIPQLHRQVQLINEGNTQNLQQFRQIFRALNRANDSAIQAIDRYLERGRQNNQITNQMNQQSESRSQTSQPLITTSSNINITLSSSLNRDNEPQSRPSQQSGNGPTTGINIQNLFSGGQIPQLTIPPGILQMLNAQMSQNQSPSSASRSQNQQNNRQQQTATRQRPSNNQQEQARNISNTQSQPPMMGNMGNMGNMMGGLGAGNIGGLFSMLGSMGGPTDIGGLMNMKINEIIKKDGEEIQQQNVYTYIFGPLKGSQIMSIMTGNNNFLLQQHKSMRQGLIKARKLCNDKQKQLIQKVAKDLVCIFLTQQTGKKHFKISNYVQLMFQKQKLQKKVQVYLKQLYDTVIQQSVKSNYSSQIQRICTMMLGNIVHYLVQIHPQHRQDVVFQSVKQAVIEFLDPYIPGLSFMLYMILEKSIKYNYDIFKADYERQKQKTNEDVLNEEKLLISIEQQAKRDAQQYANTIAGKKRSKYYEPQ